MAVKCLYVLYLKQNHVRTNVGRNTKKTFLKKQWLVLSLVSVGEIIK